MSLTLFGNRDEERWYKRMVGLGHKPDLTEFDDEGCRYVRQPYTCSVCKKPLGIATPRNCVPAPTLPSESHVDWEQAVREVIPDIDPTMVSRMVAALKCMVDEKYKEGFITQQQAVECLQ